MRQRVNAGVMIASVVVLAVLSPAGRAEPTVVFHRGTTSAMPENTLGALEWAAQAGARVIEIDVRMTADGHPVIMHDANVA
ncbi:MAG: glycerophosphodiester phosphodiesterase family protein, partial [Gammaproteobacteria bacterium]